MQVLILAAGKGKRMGDLTKNNHKSLLMVNETESFLTRLLNQLNEYPIDNIFIVTGYMNNEIEKIDVYEKETNHDIQALIMYIKTNLPDNYKEHVHFGLTSQDINNPAMVMMHREFNLNILKSDIDKLKFTLFGFVKDYSNVRMVTFTHGQPATPTSFGKQMNVFAYKISNIIDDLYEDYQYKTKMGGANGDFTALKLAYPAVDWVSIITNFINNSLKLERNPHTTQIDNYSNYFKLFLLQYFI